MERLRDFFILIKRVVSPGDLVGKRVGQYKSRIHLWRFGIAILNRNKHIKL